VAIVTALASSRLGRVLLHLLALFGDLEYRTHAAGIKREVWRQA
jgi:hypothetical protein